MQKALVTGANGFIGSALTLRLLRDGNAVRAMCRTPRKGEHLAEAGAETVGGDVQDPAAVARAAKGCDVVFHVAAVQGSAAYSYNVNVIGTRNVLEAAHAAGAGRFVHVSTIAVYGYEVEGPIDEAHVQRPSPHDFYMQSKALGEKVVRDFVARTGLPAVIIRPAMVYGPGSNFWSRRLYEACRRVGAPLVRGGRGHAHPIFIEDVVDLMVIAARHPAAPGQVFHAAPDPAPTWAEFLGHYARMAGSTAKLEIPADLLRPLSVALTYLTRLSGRPFDLAGALRFWGHSATFCMNRAAEILGWRPRFSLEEGMALTEPWLTQR